MKLAGPVLAVRVELGVAGSRAVLRGCFPPELAPFYRRALQEEVDRLHPDLFASYRRELDADIHRMIHGDPSAPKPVGILHNQKRKR